MKRKVLIVEVVKRDKEYLEIHWEHPDKGFGVIVIKYVPLIRDFVIESELMSLDFVLEVLKTADLEIKSNEPYQA